MSRRPVRFRLGVECVLLAGLALAARPGSAAPPEKPAAGGAVMLAAVSRDASVLSGGIGTGIRTRPGITNVEPVAWLTPSGHWRDLPCDYRGSNGADRARCRAFAASYLAHPHTYTVVSADGYGAKVESAPARLGNCLGFTSRGLYSGRPLQRTALAAGDPARFAPAPPLTPVEGGDYRPILRAFAAAAPVHLHTLAGIRLYRLSWGGRSLILVERSFTDFSSARPSVVPNVRLIFAAGEMAGGRFHMLFWKQDTSDANEQVLGTVVLRGGRQFLITSVNSPLAQFFRIYTLKNGRMRMVFSGGGSSC